MVGDVRKISGPFPAPNISTLDASPADCISFLSLINTPLIIQQGLFLKDKKINILEEKVSLLEKARGDVSVVT